MTEPRWKQRYRAPSLTLPRWAPDDPEHLVYVSNQSGSWQVHAWDRAAGHHRQVSDHPTGVGAGATAFQFRSDFAPLLTSGSSSADDLLHPVGAGRRGWGEAGHPVRNHG